MGQAVELVSVNDQVTLAVGPNVEGPFNQPHATEGDPNKWLQELVVVSGDECHAGFLAVLAQQLLDEHIVLVGPKPFPPQLPAIKEVADDVELGAFAFTQEINEFVHLGVLCAQMNIGDPNGAIIHWFVANQSGCAITSSDIAAGLGNS